MDKGLLMKFAMKAKRSLSDQIKQKASILGITERGIRDIESEALDILLQEDVVKYEDIIKYRQQLLDEVICKGYEQVIEDVTFTIFQRFIIARFLEVNGYLQGDLQLFSKSVIVERNPDLYTYVLSAELPIDHSAVDKMINKGEYEKLYTYLLFFRCKELQSLFPALFKEFPDYTELLFPAELLSEGSIIKAMVTTIPEENWCQVEMIGSLYQYFISDKKNEAFRLRKKKSKIEKSFIPAATQLFTPSWIVKYLVENSLGALWLENHQSLLKREFSYYINLDDQEEEVLRQWEQCKNPQLKLEDIKVVDPACGTGHILIYVFEILFKLYEEQGYSRNEIPSYIFENNLYGFDIDERAIEIAIFALLMKARQYTTNNSISLLPTIQVLAFKESNQIDKHALALLTESDKQYKQIEMILDAFEDAKNFGSLIQVPVVDYYQLEEVINQKEKKGCLSIKQTEAIYSFRMLLTQAKILSTNYDVVITNPPYMGNRGMNKSLRDYVKRYYPLSKTDLFAVFIEKTMELTKENGFIATINQHSWMFLSSFEKLRNKMLEEMTFQSMLHLGTKAFEEVNGEIVQSTAYICRKHKLNHFKAKYFQLTQFSSSKEKKEAFLNEKAPLYQAKQTAFVGIPGQPFAYWVSESVSALFKQYPGFSQFIELTGSQHITANNDQYLRYFWEIDRTELFHRWVSYAKGGSYRKWYGNTELVLDWGEGAQTFYETNVTSNKINQKYMFRKGITWSATTTSAFSCRQLINRGAFDKKGPSLFVNDDHYYYYFMGFLNSKLANNLLQILSSSIDYQNIDIHRLPIIIPTEKQRNDVTMLVKHCIAIAKEEWDSFETSWDFKRHPFLQFQQGSPYIEQSFYNWYSHTNLMFNQLWNNEQRMNKIISQIYHEDGERLNVDQRLISYRKADKDRDVRTFLSYIVGCILGRYTIDKEGITFAGGTFDETNYVSFKPNKNGIVPVFDEVRAENDLVCRLIEFIKVTYGDATIDANLEWIAEVLGKTSEESAVERIRKYFAAHFYKDHVKHFKKRPIYWLFTSGENKAFQAYVYLHRMDEHVIRNIRNNYVLRLLKNYERKISSLQSVLNTCDSIAEQKRVRKQLSALLSYSIELKQYEKKLAMFEEISIDLNDGVVSNYQRLAPLLMPIK
ncbi:BREX-1 system adenine-specific DNA-methyltransferase PglX [Anaerobacillus sp. MEB173]|uniref:BREX-1 system adenine-specific DNA-methyltransferase PglX n=1 Tax=Anaerobacillus sp. MEB173 TaxID=3383345 RepID=UPI003F92BC02